MVLNAPRIVYNDRSQNLKNMYEVVVFEIIVMLSRVFVPKRKKKYPISQALISHQEVARFMLMLSVILAVTKFIL